MAILSNPRQPVGAQLITPPRYQAVPATPTVVTARDATLFAVYLNNTTAGAITFTMTDGNGLNLMNAPIEANTAYWIESDYGTSCDNGLTWGASGVGLVGDLIVTTRAGGTA